MLREIKLCIATFVPELCYQNITFLNNFAIHKTHHLRPFFQFSQFFKNLGSEFSMTFLIQKMVKEIINLVTTFCVCLN